MQTYMYMYLLWFKHMFWYLHFLSEGNMCGLARVHPLACRGLPAGSRGSLFGRGLGVHTSRGRGSESARDHLQQRGEKLTKWQQIHQHTHACMHVRTHTHACMCAHTRMHACAHTHAHTHTITDEQYAMAEVVAWVHTYVRTYTVV